MTFFVERITKPVGVQLKLRFNILSENCSSNLHVVWSHVEVANNVDHEILDDAPVVALNAAR